MQDDPLGDRAGHRREVAGLHGRPRQRPEEQPEQPVHQLEEERLVAFGAQGEDDPLVLAGPLRQRRQHAGKVLGAVLAVGVERDHGVVVADLGQRLAQRVDDRPLVAEVERRLQNGHVLAGPHGRDLGVLAGRVVEDDEVDRPRVGAAALEHQPDALAQQQEGLDVPVDRRHDPGLHRPPRPSPVRFSSS